MKPFVFLFVLAVHCLPLRAQILTLQRAVELTLARNPSIVAAAAEMSKQTALKRAAVDIPKTEVALTTGQFNSIQSDVNVTISQSIPFPLTFHRQHRLGKEMITSAKLRLQVTKNDLIFHVKQLFNQLLYFHARQKALLQQDSLIANMLEITITKHQAGKATLLAKTTAETQRMEIANQIERNEADIETARNALKLLCQSDFSQVTGKLDGFVSDDAGFRLVEENPSQLWMQQQVKIADEQKKLESSRAFPDLKIGYFNQTIVGLQNVNGQEQYFGRGKKFQGLQFGIAIPLWILPYHARTKAASFTAAVARKEMEANHLNITRQFSEAKQHLEKNRKSLAYYRDSALKAAALLRNQSYHAFKNGELDYATTLLNLRQVLIIEEGYLSTLHEFNGNLITLQYLNGSS